VTEKRRRGKNREDRWKKNAREGFEKQERASGNLTTCSKSDVKRS
jgi:hypothetical protein